MKTPFAMFHTVYVLSKSEHVPLGHLPVHTGNEIYVQERKTAQTPPHRQSTGH